MGHHRLVVGAAGSVLSALLGFMLWTVDAWQFSGPKQIIDSMILSLCAFGVGSPDQFGWTLASVIDLVISLFIVAGLSYVAWKLRNAKNWTAKSNAERIEDLYNAMRVGFGEAAKRTAKTDSAVNRALTELQNIRGTLLSIDTKANLATDMARAVAERLRLTNQRIDELHGEWKEPEPSKPTGE